MTAIPEGFYQVFHGTIQIGDRIQIRGEWVIASAPDIHNSIADYKIVIRRMSENTTGQSGLGK